MIKTAVLGGSFDPIHNQHIEIAKAAVNELNITKLVILPALNPPHKNIVGESFDHRVEMLKIAFKNFPIDVEISYIETENNYKNYTINNLSKLKKLYGNFYFIIGGDSLLNLEKWYRPEEIVKQTNVVVFNREGYDNVNNKINELENKWNCKISKMQYIGKEVSSTEIRAKIDLDMQINNIPNEVLAYIKQKKYYIIYNDVVNKAKGYLTEKRFYHSKNTTLTALNINNRCELNLPYGKVFIASILHDIGKKYDYNDFKNLGHNIPIDSIGTPVQHQFVSERLAKNDFKIDDSDILNAIKYHTTGRADMSNLERLIYVADMLSNERNYIGIDKLRTKVYNNFEKGFIGCLNYSYKYILSTNKPIYPLTKQAVDFYKEKI